MKNQVIVIIIVFLSFTMLSAETWKYEADVSLNMNQNSYSNNWAGEEKGSISWALNSNFLAEKQLYTRLHNKTTLKLAFGQTHNQYVDEENNEKKWASPDKTTDLIDFESLFRFTLGSFVDPYISGRLESQFLDQRIITDTKLFNPLTTSEGVGILRMFLKDETKELSSRLGGSFKQYLDSRADENTNDGGLEFITEFKTLFSGDNFSFNSKLNIYKALYYSKSDDLKGTEYEDDWKAPRLNWENILTASITKLVSLNLYIDLIYNETDYDIEAKSIDEIQYKQTLTLSVTYKLL
ncbi:MAG: DUF3078 domain-containing protein [Candidatus Cloacimonetes bacterium]|nr:DUF3078 domain-containing protein [Candidatus Cloacimonadota bacterium]